MDADHQRWMTAALREAERGAAAGEVPVGAVVVRDGRLVAAAANAPITTHDPTAHAEIRALRAAGAALGNYRLPGCDLYVTVEPCAMCAGAVVQARLRTLIYGCADSKAGAAGSLFDVVGDARLNHRVTVVAGVEEARCRAVIQDFFAARR
jgi:tRNA(adenine34) deaminase